MKVKQIAARLLTAFVLVSIGYAAGREAGRRAEGTAVAPAHPGDRANGGTAAVRGVRVDVLFLHGSVRCATCNQIESGAREVVERDFAEAMADGRVTWRTANFEAQPDLASRYDVGFSSLVIIRSRDGVEEEFRRLDDVWTAIHDPPALADYVRESLRGLLGDSSP